MSKQSPQFLYRLSPKSLLLYYVALAVAAGLMLTRNKSEPWSSLPGILSTWGQHMSNFALTFLLFTGICLFWILQDMPRKAYLWLAAVFIVINIVVELFVSVLNVPDVVDIPFGIAGVLAGLGFIYLLNKTKLPIKPKK